MYYHGPSDIQNMSIFVFNNSILLRYMRAGCLMNNSIFRTEDRYIIFDILQGLLVRNIRMKVEN